MDCSLPDSSVHGILQARILEWVSVSFFRERSVLDWKFFILLHSCHSKISLSGSVVVIDKDEDSTKDDIIEEYRRKQQIELARDKKNSVESLTPEIINIASNYDLSTTIMEEEELWVLLFTYNSPKNLDLNEMDYLDELFDIATLELRNLLDRAEICVLN